MSTDRWMNKEDVVHTYNGILLSYKKEWKLAICDNMDGPRGYYAKWNKLGRERQIPYDLPYMWNLKKSQPTHRYREQIGGYLWHEGSQKVETSSYKISNGM